MKKVILFFGAAFLGSVLSAQTCPPINFPGITTTTYQTDGTHSTTGDIVWVCRGLTFDISGNGNTVFVEKGGTITLSGNSNIQFYMKGSGTLEITGDNNEVTVEHSVTVTDNGTGNVTNHCDTVVIDYTAAPSPPTGCDVFAGISDNELDLPVQYYPNPASQVLFVHRLPVEGKQMVRLFNSAGQQVLVRVLTNERNEVDVKNLETGIYVLRIDTEEGLVTRRISIH